MEAGFEERLRGLEESLLEASVRKNPELVGSMLAAEFREFGSSGRVFSRDSILQELSEETAREITLRDFRAERLAEGVVLVTYRTRRCAAGEAVFEALRSSIWVEREGRWQMVFHQGTRTDAGVSD